MEHIGSIININFGGQYLARLKVDLTLLDETLPEMMEAGDDKYDVVKKFHECGQDLLTNGIVFNYDLVSK